MLDTADDASTVASPAEASLHRLEAVHHSSAGWSQCGDDDEEEEEEEEGAPPAPARAPRLCRRESRRPFAHIQVLGEARIIFFLEEL